MTWCPATVCQTDAVRSGDAGQVQKMHSNGEDDEDRQFRESHQGSTPTPPEEMMTHQHKLLNRLFALHGSLAFILWLCTSASASVIDAPHNDTNNMTCTSCHSYSLWWEHSPAKTSDSPDFASIVNTVCMECHDTGDKIPVKTHSSAEMGSINPYHGGWGVGCTACHDPHFQRQLEWGTPAYLVEGTIDYDAGLTQFTEDIESVTYDRTTITIQSLTKEDNVNWPPSKWTQKTVVQNPTATDRGLILTQDTAKQLSTYSIVSVTTNTTTNAVEKITVNGKLERPAASSTSSSFGLSYGQLIKQSVVLPYADPTVTRQVKFVTPVDGFVDLANPPASAKGICQVCHTLTSDNTNPNPTKPARFRNYGELHTDASDAHGQLALDTASGSASCTLCHFHRTGFKGAGHVGDFGWATISYTKANGQSKTVDCTDCHDFSKSVVEIHRNNCRICHVSFSGTDMMRVAGSPDSNQVDPAYGIDGDPSGADRVTATCATCHDKTAKPNIENTLPLIHHTSPGNYFANKDCTHCHDGHANDFGWASINYTKADGTVETVNCATCHDASKSIVGVIHGNKCDTCHFINGGTVSLRVAGSTGSDNVNPANGIDGDPNGANTTATCATCHDKAAKSNITSTLPALHHTSPGNYAANGQCTHCHQSASMAGTPFTRPADHSSVVANAVTTGTAPNIVSGCVDCHMLDSSTGTNYSTNGTGVGAIIDSGFDNRRVHDACTSCHKTDGSLKRRIDLPMSRRALMVEGYAPGHGAGYIPNLDLPTTNCFSCHGTDPGLSHQVHDHSDTVGNTPACNWCHYRQVGLSDGATVDPNDPMVHPACTTCHAISRGIPGDYRIGLVDPANLNHQPALVSDMVTTDEKGDAVNCTDCHAVHLFRNHLAADHTNVVRASSEGCTFSCHADTDGNPGPGFGMNVSPTNNMIHDDCTSCHNVLTGGLRTVAEVNKPYVVAMPDPALTPNNPKDGGGECSACHGPNYFLNHTHTHTIALNTTVDPKDLAKDAPGQPCSNCHQTNGWTQILEAHGNTCNTCHTANRLTGLDATQTVADVIAAKPDTQTNCLTCHWAKQTPADHGNSHTFGWSGTCVDCHGPDTTAVLVIHKNSDCLICHVDPGSGNWNRRAGTKGSAIGATVTSTCTDCHNPTTYPTGSFHHLTTNAVNGACTTCHTTVNGVNHSGDHTTLVANGPCSCNNCHTGTAAGTNGVVPVSMTDDKIHDACTTCHTNSGPLKASYTNARGQLILLPGGAVPPSNDGGGACCSCHDYYYFVQHSHHENTNSVRANSLQTPITKNCTTSGCHLATTSPFTTGQVHSDCYTCHDYTTGALKGSAAGHTTGGECITCHTGKTDFSTHAQHTATTHAVLQRGTDQSNGALCDTCHAVGGMTSSDFQFSNSWGGATGIYTLHDSCATCHDSTRTTNVKAGYAGVQAIIQDDTLTIGCLDCHTDRAGIHGGHAATDFPSDPKCSGCHPGTSTVTDVHGDNCGLCHINPQGGGTRRAGDDGNAILGTQDGDNCLVCHNPTLFPTGAIHHDTVNATTYNCTFCHTADTTKGGDHSGKVIASPDCVACHMATAGTATGIPVSTTDNRVHDDCSTCHNTNGTLKGPYGKAISMPTHGGTCKDCHGEYFMNHTKVGAHNTFLTKATTSCLSCHDQTGGADIVADIHGENCNNCHDPVTHAMINGITVGRVVSGTTYMIGDARKHTYGGTSSCATCHSYNAYMSMIYNHPMQNRTHEMNLVNDTNCTTTCHVATDGPFDLVPEVHSVRSCSTCHGAGYVLIGSAAYPRHVVGQPSSCSTCHNENRYTPANTSPTGHTTP